MKKSVTKEISLTAVCIALGIVLPQIFMRDPAMGAIFLPMHLPILLCGIICSWKSGALAGVSVPLICSALFARPVFFPVAIAMCFELCTYGVVSSLLYKKTNIYLSLLCAMVAGRAVNGVVNAILFSIQNVPYSFKIFITSSFIKGIPGIIIQLLLIPVIVLALQKAKVIGNKNG